MTTEPPADDHLSEPQEPTAGRPRGLWQLMGRPAAAPSVSSPSETPPSSTTETDAPADAAPQDDVEEAGAQQEDAQPDAAPSDTASPEAPPAEIPSADETPADEPQPVVRSLWSVMGASTKPSATPSTHADAESPRLDQTESESAEIEPETAATADVVPSADEPDDADKPDDVDETEEPEDGEFFAEVGDEFDAGEEFDEDEWSDDSDAPEFSDELAESAASPISAAATSALESTGTAARQPVLRGAAAQRTSGGWAALLLGLLALPLSGFAFLSGMFGGLPSALCGFASLGLTFSVWTQSRSSSAARARASVGGALALIGLVLGPFVIAPAGNAHREDLAIRPTQRNLAAIGQGLDAHHQEHDAYPVGGTVMLLDGRRRGGHSWMTRLLPYIDQTAVYEQIQLDLPYDDDANLAAMGVPIESYFAAGGDRKPLAGKYAVSHFAGVGGMLTSSTGERLPAGIFEQNRAVRQRDLLRGLSQSWIVGELPGGYPPWGDSENWRTVTRGLNRDTRGFGNAAGNGAVLLFADGQARFFSNKTDPALLQRLSARGEHE